MVLHSILLTSLLAQTYTPHNVKVEAVTFKGQKATYVSPADADAPDTMALVDGSKFRFSPASFYLLFRLVLVGLYFY